MPIQHIDFTPRLLEAELPFSTLSLTGGVGGPKYETFRSVALLEFTVTILVIAYVANTILHFICSRFISELRHKDETIV